MDDERYTQGYGSETTPGATGAGYGNTAQTGYQTYTQGPVNVKPVKEKKRFFPRLIAAMALGLAFGIFAAGGFYGVKEVLVSRENTEAVITENTVAVTDSTTASTEDTNTNTASTTTNEYTTYKTVSAVTTDVTEVVEKVMPSMVSVTNDYEETVNYFGRSYKQQAESCGSGIIVGESDTEYFIATNHHVIADTVTLTVQFVDGSTATAYVKGSDEDIDIAVISVEKSDLSADTISQIAVAELGDSDSLKIGEPAIAIGNALGYGQSVTTGVISALNREIELEDGSTSSSLIQTSAAINPGNSGGALLNIDGQVVGINSSKIGATTVEGIGFAIPISEVKDLIADLSTRTTKVKVSDDEKGYLGIGCQEYDLTSLGYPEGALVAKVYEGSPAEQAGIYVYDIITAVNGDSVSSYSDLSNMLSYYKSGDTVEITLTRVVSGELKEMTVSVTLGTKDVISSTTNE